LRATAPSALAACVGAALGALALPWAPRAFLSQALPVVLVAVALYFAFAPDLTETRRHARLSPARFAATLAPVIGFYDGVFGPGAGSFYMIGFVVLTGFGLTRAMAGARFANFGSRPGDGSRRAYRRARRLARRGKAGPAAHSRRQLRDGAQAHDGAGRDRRIRVEICGRRLTPAMANVYKPTIQAGATPRPNLF